MVILLILSMIWFFWCAFSYIVEITQANSAQQTQTTQRMTKRTFPDVNLGDVKSKAEGIGTDAGFELFWNRLIQFLTTPVVFVVLIICLPYL